EGPVHAEARVRDDDVEPAEARNSRARGRVDARAIGHVARRGEHLATRLAHAFRRGIEPVEAARQQRHPRALPRKRHAQLLANARRPAGDQHGLVPKTVHGESSSARSMSATVFAPPSVSWRPTSWKPWRRWKRIERSFGGRMFTSQA